MVNEPKSNEDFQTEKSFFLDLYNYSAGLVIP